MSYNFEDQEQEFTQQLEDMDNVSELLKNCFPDIEIKKVWAQMNDKGIEFNEIKNNI